MKTPIKILLWSLAFLALSHLATAASLSLDPNFHAPFFAFPYLTSRAVLLPSGDYVMFFNVDTMVEQSTGPVMRFHSDGTFDPTFSFSHEYDGVGAVAPAPDGKLIVAASKTTYGFSGAIAHRQLEILRLFPNGSIDTSFGPARTTDGGEVRVIVVNADGTILVAGKFTEFNGLPNYGIVRLLANGTLDPAFAAVTMTCPPKLVGNETNCGIWADPVTDNTGRILIAGDFLTVNGTATPWVARLNHNGTLDSTFNTSGFTVFGFLNNQAAFPVRGIGIQSDGKIVIGGKFRVEAGFTANPTGHPYQNLPVVRLNANGSADQSYGYFGFLPPDGLLRVRNLFMQSDDKVIALSRSLWRFNSLDGSLDPSFHNPALLIEQQFDGPLSSAEAFTIAATSTGFFVGGIFTDIDDLTGPPTAERWGAAKFNLDGTLDTAFATSHREGSKTEPSKFMREADGSTVIAFNTIGGNTFAPAISHNLGKLSPTGALDLSFDPIGALNPIGSLGSTFIALSFSSLPDGSLLVTGLNGHSANYGHILVDGTEDLDYHADPNVRFAGTFKRGDGEMVVSGFFPGLDLFVDDPSMVNAAGGTQIRLLHSDGTIDSSFHLDSAIIAETQQRDISGNLLSVTLGSSVLALTPDDKIIFSYLSNDNSFHLVRLNPNGSIDSSFTGGTYPVSVDVTVNTHLIVDPQNPAAGTQGVSVYSSTETPVKQAKTVLDSKLVVMGSFSTYRGIPAHGLLRVNADGSPDPAFNIGTGAQWIQTTEAASFHPSIDNLEVGLDGKLLLTGTFEAFNCVAAPGIVSLNPDATIDTSFVPPVKRQKYDYQPAYLVRQKDGSFLLSGPYSIATDNNSPSFLRLLLPPGATTPAGSGISVDEGSVGGAGDINTVFTGVIAPGTTSASIIDPNWAGQLPPGYQIAGTNLAFEVYTTASYTGAVTICFHLPSLDAAIFDAARVLHNGGTGLADVTSSKDAASRTICATVSSLSPFVIAVPPYKASIQQPINADGSSVFSVKRGVVPVKFVLASNGAATCHLPGANISLTRTAGAVLGSIDEATYLLSSDNGSNFRIDGCQYVYNLSTTSLGSGTYKVGISIGGIVVGSGTFSLK